MMRRLKILEDNAFTPAEGILETVRRYPGRTTTVHIKEFSNKNPNALIGEVDMKWKEFFELCKKIGGTEWYIVEQESYVYHPLECVKLCIENIRKINLLG